MLIVYCFVKFANCWLYYGRPYCFAESSLSVSHIGSAKPMERVVYSGSSLSSIRRNQPKQHLPSNVMQKLGDLGIRKPFRSKRCGRTRNRDREPVVNSTGNPYVSSLPPTASLGPTPGHDSCPSVIHLPTSPKRDAIRTKAAIPTFLVCNVRSLAPKIDELECVINQNDVDLVCVSETWLSDEIPDSAISMRDFILFRKDRTTRGGGVAAYINSAIPCKRLAALDLSGSITETLWLQLRPVRLPRPVSSLFIGIVYHPPQATANDNNKLYDHIQKTVDLYLLDHPDSLVCIVGDFNPNSTNILPASFKRGCGLTQTVKILTRDTGTLDWCLTNQPKMLSTPKQLPKIGSSDHYCFLVQQGPPRAKSSKRTVTRCDTRDSRIRKFGQWITSFSWHEIYSAISCKGKFERFHRTLAGAIDRFMPARVHSLHSTDKPWMTTKIKAWITKRQKCLASYGKDSPTFKVWRNKVQRSIKHCKRTFYNTKVKNLKDTNIGRWWKEVKNLSGLSNNEGQWYQQLIDGTTIDSVDTLCERINQLFIGLISGFVLLSPDDVDSFDVP